MINERYLIGTEEAKKNSNRFYTQDEDFQALRFISRENGNSNSIIYHIKGFKEARCRLTMHTLFDSLVQIVEISGHKTDKFDIKKLVEKALEFELLYPLPS
ncbi:MAG: hypothetical protein AABX03_01570 [Nanoarchaeota archaeon]